MPNWCSTRIEFVGNVTDIEDLHNKIIEYTEMNSMENGFGEWWLGNVVCGFGYKDRIDIDSDKNIRCRGTVEDIGEVTTYRNETYFTIDTETAWCPMIKMWELIIKEHYDNRIKIYWLAEECGNGLYETNNINHFINEAYKVDWSFEGTNGYNYDIDFFAYSEDVVEYVNQIILKYRNSGMDTDLITMEQLQKCDENYDNLYLSGEDDNCNWYITVNILHEVASSYE